MKPLLLAFALGLLVDICLAVQTRLTASGRTLPASIQTFVTAVVWSVSIRALVLDASSPLPYSFGAALGVAVGIEADKRFPAFCAWWQEQLDKIRKPMYCCRCGGPAEPGQSFRICSGERIAICLACDGPKAEF